MRLLLLCSQGRTHAPHTSVRSLPLQRLRGPAPPCHVHPLQCTAPFEIAEPVLVRLVDPIDVDTPMSSEHSPQIQARFIAMLEGTDDVILNKVGRVQVCLDNLNQTLDRITLQSLTAIPVAAVLVLLANDLIASAFGN